MILFWFVLLYVCASWLVYKGMDNSNSYSNSNSMGIEGLEEQKSSSGGSQGEGEGEEKGIILLALNDESLHLGRLEDGSKRHCLGRVDFHWVDLKHNKLTPHLFPSLIMVEVATDIVRLNDFIYMLGGVPPFRAHAPDIQLLLSQSPASNRTFYFGGSSLDMSMSAEAAQWCPFPLFNSSSSCNCVSFLGKIYNFGSNRLEPEVLDPRDQLPMPIPIPPSLVDCSVYVPVLVDPDPVPDPFKKCCILIRLYGGPLSSPSLFAFTPPVDADDDGDGIETWYCLTPDFQVWANSAAVVNDVIYFHCHEFPSHLHAFHIAKKQWLKVWWDSCFKDGSDFNVERIHFDAMLHLGNNILCFVAWIPRYTASLEIIFYKFQVLQVGQTTVIVNPCDFYSYILPETDDGIHFVSL